MISLKKKILLDYGQYSKVLDLQKLQAEKMVIEEERLIEEEEAEISPGVVPPSSGVQKYNKT